PVRGPTGFVFCVAGGAAAPHAAPLITWFRVNGQVADETSEEFVRLLVAWAEHARVPPLDARALEDELALWRRGEL
ncbi:DUF6300 family protein, partial [Nonomuraea sp. NPDC050405]|uniref:DUF6300 family protein n=1 Tax=Nonomuraea sp. NPDC050405 TaxID=3154509 RepID=UPI0033FDB50D